MESEVNIEKAEEEQPVFEAVYEMSGFTVHGCPRNVRLKLNPIRNSTTVEFAESKLNVEVKSKMFLELSVWIQGRNMTEAVYDWLEEMFEFVPFYRKEKDGKLWYVPNADFMSKEIMRGRRKPIVTQKFMGVEEFPVALLRQMQVLEGLMESAEDLQGISKFPETIDTSKLDPDVVAQIKPALEALLPGKRDIEILRAHGYLKLEFLPIYEWLGLNRAIKDEEGQFVWRSYTNLYFIDGDQLRDTTDTNLAEAGQLWDYVPVKLFPQLYEFGDLRKLTDCENMSDNMIVEYRLWDMDRLLAVKGDLKVSPIQARLMQFLLRRNGYLN